MIRSAPKSPLSKASLWGRILNISLLGKTVAQCTTMVAFGIACGSASDRTCGDSIYGKSQGDLNEIVDASL